MGAVALLALAAIAFIGGAITTVKLAPPCDPGNRTTTNHAPPVHCSHPYTRAVLP